MRREDLGVTVHVATAAGWYFKYVHMQSQFLIPGQQSVVVVDLDTRGTVVLRDERAARMWIAVTKYEIVIKIIRILVERRA